MNRIFFLIPILILGCKAPDETAATSESEISPLSSHLNAAAQCSVHQLDEGVKITCGTTSAILRHGSIGPEGPRGLTGATGSIGPVGAIGPQGPQGIQGAPGLTGLTGNRGPRGPEGPAGGASAPSEFWLVEMDGSLIGRIIGRIAYNYFSLWDDRNQMVVTYSYESRLPDVVTPSGYGSIELYFPTPDCSGDAYTSASPSNAGSRVGFGFTLASNFYKITDEFSSFVVKSSQREQADGTLSACQSVEWTNVRDHWKVTPVSDPTFPASIPIYSYKFEYR